MKTETYRFWMVWSPTGSAPTYRHVSRDSAEREALRLARQNAGRQFFVLKAVGGFETETPDPKPIRITRCPYNEIPF